MSQFRAKKLDLGGFINARIIRDHTKRKVFEQHEPERYGDPNQESSNSLQLRHCKVFSRIVNANINLDLLSRQALRYIIRNTALPQRTRAQAQLQLSQMHAYTRPTQIKNRCVAGGIARSVFRDFRIARFQFRMQALAGELPGVKKASCTPAHYIEIVYVLTFIEHPSPSEDQLLFKVPPDTPSLAMFVFHKQDLPADPVFPASLDKLGYFINDIDQIRKISDPTQEFQFKINKNDRWNEVQRGAMNECIRSIVLSRLHALGLVTLRLPLTSGPTKPHVPILVSRNLSTASRIILVFGEPIQDLGIWAYRTIGSESINAGSVVDLVKAVLHPEEPVQVNGTGLSTTNPRSSHSSEKKKKVGDTAIVLANTGQLVWHCGTGKAMTINSWLSLPRASAVDPPLAETKRNKIPRNANWQEHVESVFDGIFATRGQLVRADARIDVIGAAEGGLGAVRYLARNWQTWHPYISAICLATPLHTIVTDIPSPETNTNSPPSFRSFLATRCRAYHLSYEPLGYPLPGVKEHGCNCYSSGEELNAECIMPRVWRDMLGWLGRAFEDKGFGEEELVVREVLAGEDGSEVDGGEEGEG
ncbi:Arb2 domain-containing protein [Aspergillus spectabilis]